MRKQILSAGIVLSATILFFSCQKEREMIPQQEKSPASNSANNNTQQESKKI